MEVDELYLIPSDADNSLLRDIILRLQSELRKIKMESLLRLSNYELVVNDNERFKDKYDDINLEVLA